LTTAGAARPAATADPPGPRASPTVPVPETPSDETDSLCFDLDPIMTPG